MRTEFLRLDQIFIRGGSTFVDTLRLGQGVREVEAFEKAWLALLTNRRQTSFGGDVEWYYGGFPEGTLRITLQSKTLKEGWWYRRIYVPDREFDDEARSTYWEGPFATLEAMEARSWTKEYRLLWEAWMAALAGLAASDWAEMLSVVDLQFGHALREMLA